MARNRNPDGQRCRYTKSNAAGVGRAGRDRAAVPAVRHGPDRAQPGRAPAQRRPAAKQRPAAVDRGHLRVHGRWAADHHGHPGGSHRPPPAPAHRRRRLRRRFGAGRLVHHRRAADRRPRAAGGGGGDPGALNPVADPQHVPRRAAAHDRHRGVDRLLLGRRRDRAAGRRGAAGALLVGLGVPAGGASDGAAAGGRPAAAARVPRRGGGAAGPSQRWAVAGRGPADHLWAQAARPGWSRLAAGAVDPGWAWRRDGVRTPPAAAGRSDA